VTPVLDVDTEMGASDVCVFTEDAGYLIFSSVISFYFPVSIILFAYYRIYVAATAQTRGLITGSKVLSSKIGSRIGSVTRIRGSRGNILKGGVQRCVGGEPAVVEVMALRVHCGGYRPANYLGHMVDLGHDRRGGGVEECHVDSDSESVITTGTNDAFGMRPLLSSVEKSCTMNSSLDSSSSRVDCSELMNDGGRARCPTFGPSASRRSSSVLARKWATVRMRQKIGKVRMQLFLTNSCYKIWIFSDPPPPQEGGNIFGYDV